MTNEIKTLRALRPETKGRIDEVKNLAPLRLKRDTETSSA